MPLPPLSEWESFYVITGSSGAALTGLMFVVITLAADRIPSTGQSTSAFGTPNVVHFALVLLIASLMTIPRETATTLGWCLLATALGGLMYAVTTVVTMRRQKVYKPVLEDWIFHALFPVSAYLALAVAALLMWSHPLPALYMVAGVTLFLMFIGVHNAWDAAVYIAMHEKK